MRRIRRVSLFEASNSFVVRVLVQGYEKMDLAFGEKNRLDIYGGERRLVHPFIRQEFWKCIGCILLVVTYGNKEQNIWGGGLNIY